MAICLIVEAGFVFCIFISRYPFNYLFLKLFQNLNFSSSCSQARETIQQYRNTSSRIKDLYNSNFTSVFTLVATFRLSMYRNLFAFFILSSICCFHYTSAATSIPRSLTVVDFAKSFPFNLYCWSLPLKFRYAHISIASSILFWIIQF